LTCQLSEDGVPPLFGCGFTAHNVFAATQRLCR